MVMNLLVCSVFDLLHKEEIPHGFDPVPARPLRVLERLRMLEDAAQGMALLHDKEVQTGSFAGGTMFCVVGS